MISGFFLIPLAAWGTVMLKSQEPILHIESTTASGDLQADAAALDAVKEAGPTEPTYPFSFDYNINPSKHWTRWL